MKKYIGEIGLFFTSIVWGTGFVGTKLSLEGGLTPLQLITIRFLIASIFINIIFYKQIKANINKDAIKCGAIMGVFLFIAFVVQTIGLVYTTPSKNAFLTAVNVVIVPLIGVFVYRQKLDKIGVISSLLTLIGIGVLSLEQDLSINIGDFLTLICALGYALHIFFTSEFTKNHSPIVLTGVQFTVTFVLSLIVQVLLGEGNLNANSTGYVGALYLGVFSTTLAFLLQTICQKRVDGTKTAIILSTEAVFGTLFSIIFLHEFITPRMIIGSIIIFTSIIMAETKLSFLKVKKLNLEPVKIEAKDKEL